ncbi:MAG: sulfotransferase [Acetobacteraceae bacterium]|nr:sulfotransferase [Acetobacteraceae bacterium]
MRTESDALNRMEAAISLIRERQLFFVGGMPKSGTTWMQLLLDAHPEIACRGEGHFCDRLGPLLGKAIGKYREVIHGKNTTVFTGIPGFPLFAPKDVKVLAAAAFALLLASYAGDTPIVGEKTPDNLMAFPVLRDMFPWAKFIAVLRDGRDCLVSGWFHNLRVSERDTYAAYPNGIDDLIPVSAKAWAQTATMALDFCEAFPGDARLVRYEDMIAQPEATFASVLEFLGARADPPTVQACLQRNAFATLSGGRHPGEEDRSSFFRKGVPGDWANVLTDAQVRAFEREAGVAMQRAGYTLAGDGAPVGEAALSHSDG